ncbi:hypothetical protein KJ969_03125 [Patescibacteria group bacterium]|nr:hypothetical protein [Patescibacteria group bacterium]MBU1921863.1 hypothetical protein [Patescibacteria group bacterium]
MKKSFIWLLLAIVAVVIIIGLVLWFTRAAEEWQSYENSRYNFSLDYPADWTLGDAETNNQGRGFYSPDEAVYCYAYGFANALMNDQGEPQTLDEFMDWLTDDSQYAAEDEMYTRVLSQEAATLDNNEVVHVVIEQKDSIKEAIYALGKESGIGFFCIYDNVAQRDAYEKIFDKMAQSFDIGAALDGEGVISGTNECVNLLNGVIVPFKDAQIFVDENYTEVTVTSREYWNRELLPAQVVSLEGQGYACYPMPLEFEEQNETPGMDIEPAVKSVQWQCELEYETYEYLASDDLGQKTYLENQGYACEKEECFTDGVENDFVWLCTK